MRGMVAYQKARGIPPLTAAPLLLYQYAAQYLAGGVFGDGVYELGLAYLLESGYLPGDESHRSLRRLATLPL